MRMILDRAPALNGMGERLLLGQRGEVRRYTPRRANMRWREGAPPEILDCFLANGSYLVLLTGCVLRYPEGEVPTRSNVLIPGLELSDNPRHPQGVAGSFDMRPFETQDFRYRRSKQRIRWLDVPPKARAFVEECIAEVGEEPENEPLFQE